MTVLRSILLFVLAALAEIGGAWLVWQGVREHRGLVFVGAGIVALGLYGFVATFQPDPHFGRILAAYGGVFVAGSLAWGMAFDGFRPDRYDLLGGRLVPGRGGRDHVRTPGQLGPDRPRRARGTHRD
jgi:small multidrug resistance family-3 protein